MTPESPSTNETMATRPLQRSRIERAFSVVIRVAGLAILGMVCIFAIATVSGMLIVGSRKSSSPERFQDDRPTQTSINEP